MRDRSLSPGRIQKLWSEVKDYTTDEISEGARRKVKELLEKGILEEFEELVRCRPYERSQERSDYRNGYYCRGLLTTMGQISEIRIPRARRVKFQSSFFGWYQRRQEAFDMAVRTCFVSGASTRKMKAITEAFSGAGISASSVSRILKGVDGELRAFRKSPITGRYRFLFIDALWVTVRKRYDIKSPVLFALAIDHKGRKKLLGFKLALSESEIEWASFLKDLLRRGLDDLSVELIIHDGAGGIAAAISELFPYTRSQLCSEHKIRAAATYLQNKRRRSTFMAQARDIYDAEDPQEARRKLDRFTIRWKEKEPKAVNTLRRNFNKTLAFMQFEKHLWRTLRTTNPLERYQQEIRRRIRPMRSFRDYRSCERIVYAIALALNKDMPK
jgi:transposase-like protein